MENLKEKINKQVILKKICLFCGSNPGNNSRYVEATRRLTEVLVKKEIRIIYGGASVGLMGVVAKTCQELNGKITGVIPKALADKEVACSWLDDLRIVETMHQRKALMADLSDGFIALPGGLGTIEELFEMLTWGQLGIHHKPVGILNIDGYFDHLTRFLEHTVNQGFIAAGHKAMLQVSLQPGDLLQKMESYQPPDIDKARLALSQKTGQNF